MTTSEAGIQMIKDFEGFSPYPVADSGQWCIGYGNICNPANYPNGITEAGADALLRSAVTDFEDSLNRYTASYGIELTQTQFDALVSITYNLGVAWINSDYRFWTMLRTGLEHYTDNQIASAIGVWCHTADKQVNSGLLERRITEIRLFLYGDAADESRPDFNYVVFDGNGGGIETDVMLYLENEPYYEFTEASRSGYYFAGWYTAKEGGSYVAEGDLSVDNQRLYARWSDVPVTLPEPVFPGETTDEVPEEEDSLFPDVKQRDWFYTYVVDLFEAGVIEGHNDGTFGPNEPVTAGQALKLILLASGYGIQEPTSSHWASGYRSIALQKQWVHDGEIGDLDAPISRVLIAKLAAGALELEILEGETVFADCDDPYVLALQRLGVVEGSVDRATGLQVFLPDESIIRAEIAKIVWMIEKL